MGLFKKPEEQTKKLEAELMNMKYQDEIDKLKVRKAKRQEAQKGSSHDPDMNRLLA